MSELRYHFRKCLPLVGIYLFGLFVMIWALQSNLHAGDTMFKECKHCGHLNYQFSNTCSMCGTSGRFEDVYLKPDCEKRDAKKKKAKSISSCGFTESGERGKELYEQYIKPIEILIYQSCYEDTSICAEMLSELILIRENLIEILGLEKYRKDIFKDFINNRSVDYPCPRYGD